MRELKNMRDEFFRVENDNAVFVKAAFVDKDRKSHLGLFMLDSGSNHNYLFSSVQELVDDSWWIENETQKTVSMGNQKGTSNVLDFSFVMGAQYFKEKFCMCDSEIEFVDELPVFGVLGNIFLREQRLALDYGTHSVYTSEVTPSNLCINDCSYFMPMGFGFDHYGVPVLVLGHNNNYVIAIADTGSASNIFSKSVLAENGEGCSFSGEETTVSSILGSFNTRDAIIEVEMNGLGKNGESRIQMTLDCQIIDEDFILKASERDVDEEGNRMPDIKALIGSSFFGKQGWILDFGASIIYKRKSNH